MPTAHTKQDRESGATAPQKEGKIKRSHAYFHGSTAAQGVHGTQGVQTQTMIQEEIGVQQNLMTTTHTKPDGESGATAIRVRLPATYKVSLKVLI